MHVTALIVAGGRGRRTGTDRPKQFLALADGRRMIDVVIATFLSCPAVTDVIVALPPDAIDEVAPAPRLRVVAGGARRQDSTARAFAAADPRAGIVAIHDAARPFVTHTLITKTIAAAQQHGAAIAAVAVRDTVKLAFTTRDGRVVARTLKREDVYLAQTPQAFRREILEQALVANESFEVTDEAMLVERAGLPVHLVAGDPENVKITTAEDLDRALVPGPMSDAGDGAQRVSLRVGHGYDLHRLVAGRPLILAGVDVQSEQGLAGHSDADIVCHAVTDALLGACALGDIGQMFPDTDPQWKNADSVQLLQRAAEAVRSAGFRIGNVDVTVIAERPKLRPYVDRMRARLAEALRLDVSAVSIKGKTNEGVDATGQGEAMACHAVATVLGGSARRA